MNKYQYTQYQLVEPSNSLLGKIFSSILRNWVWFLFTISISGIGAYTYLKYKQPTYQIQASLMIIDNKVGQESSNALKEIPDLEPKKVVENEIDILHSYRLMKRVVDKLNLNIHYYKSTTFGKWEIYRESPIIVTVDGEVSINNEKTVLISFVDQNVIKINDKLYPVNKKINIDGTILKVKTKRIIKATDQPVHVLITSNVGETANWLEVLKVTSAGKNSSIINLSLEDLLPERGEEILNQLIKEYNQTGLTDKSLLANNTLQFIDKRLEGISNDIVQIEAGVASYKTQQSITDLSAQSKTLLESVQSAETLLNQVSIQLASLGDLEAYLNNRSGKRGITPATLGLQDQILNGLIEKLIGLEQERDQLAQLTAEQNMLVEGLDNQIKAIKGSIRENVQTMRSSLNTSQLQLKNRIADLDNQIRSIPLKERQLMDITREQTVKKELYTYLLKKREEIAVSFTINFPTSQVIEPAIRSVSPIKPVKVLVYGIALVLAFLLPLTIIESKKLLSDRVGRRDDVELQTNVPILGEVAKQPKIQGIIDSDKNFSVTAEQIGILRTKLQKIKKAKAQSLAVLITSSISGEGKSFLSLNVGASLAMAGLPTVLVEFDLRNPKLHGLLGIQNEIGISNYLNGECTIDQALNPVSGHPYLSLLSCGQFDSSPAELLSNPRLEQMFNELKERYAYILIDTPPVSILSDAYQLASFADTTLFIIRHGVTPKKSINVLNSLSDEEQFPELMIVLNGITEGAPYNITDKYHSYNKYNVKTTKRLDI